MNRNQIDRLTERVEAIEAWHTPRRFQVVRTFVPREQRPGETAAEAYRRELAEAANR